ncbi:aldehyde dehydrogenase [Mycobacterium montefiorense]|uniref:Putative succinate-semialdehyde dehydrogenase [NADP(+)] 2 n=1 Tax=Mycobacterium montefiorense TaxID=154654 RepID=A0AA37PQL1_9MYCO|nr:aldehyde dehydrogenase [Mycobacterium montefiorense]GKU37102.1 aldehyde dehydrogenase [Mycobacterium montefiorense]GKU40095.1 aldehyde dehydrogenase [Mycobacterium montefiorense]GKU46526.1 aldehyde dehydrogenase [Mycobacterium montefiorense]GKU50420.1 aldehyde dehydrogenase [Mycobacterium montefiorense]
MVKCPATGDIVGRVPVSTTAEVKSLADRLRAAQPAWQQMGVAGRAEWLGKWRDWMLDHRDDVLTPLQLETGKSWADTGVEIAAVQIVNYWIDTAAEFLADQNVRPWGAANLTKKLTIVYEPYPLVGVITPWNGPLSVPLLDVPAALMAGCAVLSKPSEITPLAWQVAVEGWKQIGAPEVLDVVFGFGETGAALVDVVDYVMFTGSLNTGRRIAVAAAQRLIPCSLELGGKDAMIVCADADIDRAVDGAVWGGFVYSGQVCISVERIYVEEPIYDEFVNKLVAKTSQLRQGMDAAHDYSAEIGSLTTEQQLAIVSRHVDDAVSKGAKVLVGGKSSNPAGLFYEPTVLVDVDHGMDCMREETFGPTLPVMKVRDVAEAIEKANDSNLGLAGSVWPRDKDKANAVARQMNTGTVNINNVITGLLQFGVPMPGWKESGLGSRSGGADGIRKYCRQKSIVAERVAMKTELLWYPYSRKKGRFVENAVRLLSARDWRRRLGR